MTQTRELAAVIDIGTSVVRAMVGRSTANRRLEILALSEEPSKGVRNGAVVNIDEVAQTIQRVVSQLEKQLNLKIKKLIAGISGQRIHIREYSCYRVVDQGVVTEEHINALIDEARRHAAEIGEKGYHVIPQEYSVDGETGIANPVGMSGRKVAALFNVIVASENYELNIKQSMAKAGYELAGTFINSFVQGDAFLSGDEREAGVVLIDFGAGTTGVSLYYENVLKLAFELPFGGNVITSDIREGCSIIVRHAELVKRQFGVAIADLAPENKVAQIPEVDGWPSKEISFKNLAGIIQARLEEILEGIYFQLQNTGLLDRLGAGVVITGGGSHLNGIDKLVSYHTGLEVRRGRPSLALQQELFSEKYRSPNYANLMGLMVNALILNKQHKLSLGMVVPINEPEPAPRQTATKKSGGLKGFFEKAKEGLNELLADDGDTALK